MKTLKTLSFFLMLCITQSSVAESRYERRSDDETVPDLEVRETTTPDRFTGPSPKKREEAVTEDPFSDEYRDQATRTGRAISLSLLLQTPLILENTFDKRFAAFGASGLVSTELMRLNRGWLHGELGVGFNLSNLREVNLNLDFSHVFVTIPFRLRWILPIFQSFDLEILGGLEAKILEYNSLANRGWNGVSIFGNMEPVLAVGAVFPISDQFDIRATAGLLYLTAGIEWRL